MALSRWTDASIRSVKPRNGQTTSDYSDPAKSGLILRVTALESGEVRRFWRRKYRMKGDDRQRTFIIGEYPEVSLADARTEAARIKELARRGLDPQAQVERAREAREVAGSFSQLVTIVLADGISPKTKRSLAAHTLADMRRMAAMLPDDMQRKSALDITSDDIRRVVTDTYSRARSGRRRDASGSAATRLLSFFSSVFRRADQLGLTPHGFNPAKHLESPAPVGKRDRVLTDDEIRRLWAYLCGDAGQMSRPVRLALAVALATGQRIGEILSARIEHLDLVRSLTWVLPATKSGRPHTVPLSSLAADLMNQAQGQARHGWLFPTPRTQDHHIRVDSVSTAIERDRAIIGIDEHWTAHTLRHTCSTKMGNIGVSRFTVGMILNHSDGGITARYDHAQRLPEMCAALELWASELRRIAEQRAP